MVEPNLALLESATLHELDAVRLQDRIDTKYLFPIKKLPAIIAQLRGNYKCLEIEGNRSFKYYSTYYDNSDLKLYYDHHRGKGNRFKVRVREYLDSHLTFFEVKAKTNRSRTVKSRVQLQSLNELQTNEGVTALDHIYKITELDLKPLLDVYYSRITLVNRSQTERVTIDTGLKYVMGDKSRDYSDMVVAEVKQARNSKSQFKLLMRALHIHPVSLSKYCYGIMNLMPEVKSNNFKRSNIQYQKMIYGISARTAN